MLRLLTLNLWNLSGPWRERRAEVLAWLARLTPDVVCLQEVVDDGTRNSARWLADQAGGWHVSFAGSKTGDVEFGNAVMSRWPIDRWETFDLPHEPDPLETERVLLHISTAGLDVFSTHLAWPLDAAAIRERQAAAVDDLVRQHADPASAMPPILAGDFNAEPDSTAIRFLSGLESIDGKSTYWADAWRVAGEAGPGWTWDNRNLFAAADIEPDRRLDYIFVGLRKPGGAGRVDSCRVVCDRPLTGTLASDHYGVYAEIAR